MTTIQGGSINPIEKLQLYENNGIAPVNFQNPSNAPTFNGNLAYDSFEKEGAKPSTGKNIAVGTGVTLAIALAGDFLLTGGKYSKKIWKSIRGLVDDAAKKGDDVVSNSKPDKSSAKSNKIIERNKDKYYIDNGEAARQKVNDVIEHNPVPNVKRTITNNIEAECIENIDTTKMVRGKRYARNMQSNVVTAKQQEIANNKIKFKPATKEQNIAMQQRHQVNKQQRAELNSIGQSKDGEKLTQLRENVVTLTASKPITNGVSTLKNGAKCTYKDGEVVLIRFAEGNGFREISKPQNIAKYLNKHS
ncbi:MAG: hypothetical protein R3Y28_04240 [Candidatus Gastranaerophilales bacterium]